VKAAKTISITPMDVTIGEGQINYLPIVHHASRSIAFCLSDMQTTKRKFVFTTGVLSLACHQCSIPCESSRVMRSDE